MTTVEITPELLFEQNRGLVYWCVNRLSWRNLMDRNDMIQEANLALWKASCGFNPERGFKFSTYAVPTIKGAIWNAIKREWKQNRKVFQGSSNEPDGAMTVEQMAVSKNEPVEENLIRSEELEKFRGILATIDGALGETLHRRADGQTLQEIGTARGVSRQRVEQNLISVRHVVRVRMEGKPVTPLATIPVAEPEIPLKERIADLWRKFYTVAEIAKALDVTPEAVQAAKNEARQIAVAAVSP